MGRVVFVAEVDGQLTGDVTFSVAVDGGPATVLAVDPSGWTFFDVPDGAGSVWVEATPMLPDFWPLSGTFVPAQDGTLETQSSPADLVHGTLFSLFGFTVGQIRAYLSRVRDVTSTVLASLQLPEGAGIAAPAPAAWAPPSYGPINYALIPVVDGGPALSIAPVDVTDNSDWVVFEIANVRAPRTVAVAWPAGIPRTTDQETPFLIYLQHTLGQYPAEMFPEGTYPFGFDYVWYGLWQHLIYTGDPLLRYPYCKGTSAQIAASSHPVVLVVPCNRRAAHVIDEIDAFRNVAFIEAILLDIQGAMFRRVANYGQRPALGRTGLASFSSGTWTAREILASPANWQHRFYLDTLREVYLFDISDWARDDVVATVRAWQAAGSGADKLVRAYAEAAYKAYRTLAPAVPGMPSDSTAADGRASVTYAPRTAWQQAINAQSNPFGVNVDWSQAHHLFSAIMLTDALSRSRF
jgi:hypothetical protein